MSLDSIRFLQSFHRGKILDSFRDMKEEASTALGEELRERADALDKRLKSATEKTSALVEEMASLPVLDQSLKDLDVLKGRKDVLLQQGTCLQHLLEKKEDELRKEGEHAEALQEGLHQLEGAVSTKPHALKEPVERIGRMTSETIARSRHSTRGGF